MSDERVVSGVDFAGEQFTVRAAFIGSSYTITNGDGGVLLRAKRNRGKNRTRYVYNDATGAGKFRFKGAEWGKRSHEFTLISEESRIYLAQLTRKDPDSQYGWELRTEQEDRIHAVITRDTSNGLFDTSGWDVPIVSPMSMTARTQDGEEVAVVEGRSFATRFTFDVEVTGLSGLPKATLILAVPVLYETMRPQFYGGG